MSVLVNLSSYFYAVCSHLASGINTAKHAVQYVAQINYNIVATALSILNSLTETILMVIEQVLFYVKAFGAYVMDFFDSISSFIDSLLSSSWKVIYGIQTSVMDLYTSIGNTTYCFANSLSDMFLTVKDSMMEGYESISSVFHSIISGCVSVVVALVTFLTNIGHFCVCVVTGAWQGLGFVLASIAYFPVYCFECIESLKNKAIENVGHAFTAMPKESYLGIICLCLLYFALSNAVRYLSCNGVKLFSTRLRSRRRRPGFEWQLDRDFESDLEDMYGSDGDDNVWMIHSTVTGPGLENDNVDASDDDSDSSESTTVSEDNDVSDEENNEDDEDEGSEDGYTVISDDSDSDSSFMSQTLSTESSEHEIEVSLPAVDDRYSLRSRSSTPSSTTSKSLNSPEEFTREMERERDKRKCVVCQDQIKSVLVMPCRHMCLCVLCADQIVRSQAASRRVCPLCRTKITKVMNVYV